MLLITVTKMTTQKALKRGMAYLGTWFQRIYPTMEERRGEAVETQSRDLATSQRPGGREGKRVA